MSLLERLKKTSRLEGTDVLADSKFFDIDFAPTEIPALNIALSGEVDGGLESGILMLAGPSKHFKSLFSLIIAGAYMKKHKDAVMMFYDSEFGSSKEYFTSCGIDPARVLHLPFKNIEELKFDIVNQLEGITRGERVILFIDSIGNSASKKEVQDAIDENSAADMSRAKALKGLFRMITPYLKIKNLPAIIVNHIYMEQTKYPKAIVSGGCLLAGTKIRTESGIKNIEDITEGELVHTLNGLKEVTATWNPETLDDGEPECYEIEFEDGTIVTCSSNHKFLVNDVWIEAERLTKGTDCKKL